MGHQIAKSDSMYRHIYIYIYHGHPQPSSLGVMTHIFRVFSWFWGPKVYIYIYRIYIYILHILYPGKLQRPQPRSPFSGGLGSGNSPNIPLIQV